MINQTMSFQLLTARRSLQQLIELHLFYSLFDAKLNLNIAASAYEKFIIMKVQNCIYITFLVISVLSTFTYFQISSIKNIQRCDRLVLSLRNHETTILHILGTEILEQLQNDLLTNFKLEITTKHIPGPSGSQFCQFLVIPKRLILRYGKIFENKKVNLYHLIIQSLQSYCMWPITINKVIFL